MTADLNSPIAATGRITRRNILVGVYIFARIQNIGISAVNPCSAYTCDPSGNIRSLVQSVTLPDQQQVRWCQRRMQQEAKAIGCQIQKEKQTRSILLTQILPLQLHKLTQQQTPTARYSHNTRDNLQNKLGQSYQKAKAQIIFYQPRSG